MVKKYDLVVVGSGSGLDVASAAAQNLGWKVALIEHGPLGGTCLNRGCIPSKMVIHSADVAETIKTSRKFGIKATIESIDFKAVTDRANNSVDADSQEIRKSIKQSKILDLYQDTGYFTGPKRLRIGNQEIEGEKILIAAGAENFIPPVEGLSEVDYWTSTEALRATKQPKSLVIIGGGYIAAELGHFYGALGTEITVIQRSEPLIKNEDIDVAKKFTEVFSKKYNVLLNTDIKRIEQSRKRKVIHLDNGKKIEAEALLVATGLKPNTDILKIENTEVEVDERGYIKVNQFMETTQENTWALGDIVGKYPFKHAANFEAQHVFVNMTGRHKHAIDYSVMPHAIFSSPQVAGVGLTEQEAKEKGVEYEVRRSEYKNTGMGEAIGEEDGFVKFLIEPEEEKILGCHILGPEAATLIHEVIVVMNTGLPASAISNAIHIHPALSEVVQRAL